VDGVVGEAAGVGVGHGDMGHGGIVEAHLKDEEGLLEAVVAALFVLQVAGPVPPLHQLLVNRLVVGEDHLACRLLVAGVGSVPAVGIATPAGSQEQDGGGDGETAAHGTSRAADYPVAPALEFRIGREAALLRGGRTLHPAGPPNTPGAWPVGPIPG